jgi:hypothetical protein
MQQSKAKWEAVAFGPANEYVTLYRDGNDVFDDAPIVTEIARKLNAFEEIQDVLRVVSLFLESGPDKDTALSRNVMAAVKTMQAATEA